MATSNEGSTTQQIPDGHHQHHHQHHDHHHQHGHGHDHEHGHVHDPHVALLLQNQEYFDKNIASPDLVKFQPFLRMYKAIGEELVGRRDWFHLPVAAKNSSSSSSSSSSASATTTTAAPAPPSPIRLLDYACGGGHASRTLLPYVDSALGMDVSAKSVAAYNEWAAEHGAAAAMRAVQANLMAEEEESQGASGSGSGSVTQAPEFHGFDLAVFIMALHHVGDPRLAIARLAQRLRPGGCLVIVDWNQDGSTLWKKDEAAWHTLMTRGFSRETLADMFDAAGCDDFDYQHIESYTETGVAFIAKARRRA